MEKLRSENSEVCKNILNKAERCVQFKTGSKKKVKRKPIKDNTIILENRIALANKRRKELIANQTVYEKNVKAHLESLEIEYEFQKIMFTLDNYFYIVDFYLPGYNIILEVDGRHHKKEGQKKRDNKRSRELKKLGIEAIIRLPNKHCFTSLKTRENIKNRIKGVIKKRK